MTALGKLGLGTVQWGIPYGIANHFGQVPRDEVSRILTAAASMGITVLDTAAGYGEAEKILGENNLENFRVVTKTPSFKLDSIDESHAQLLVDSLERSLDHLGRKRIYGLLVHHADDLLTPGGGRLVSALRTQQERGVVKKVGVSIYRDDQLDGILKVFVPDIVQLPLSVLDQRLINNGRLAMLKDLGVEIHVRSVFLQGLLLMNLASIPAYFDPIRPLLEKWHRSVRDQGMTPVQAALSFVRNLPWVDAVLVGVESYQQFLQCASDFSAAADFDGKGLACDVPEFVNPAEWKLQ